MNTLAHGTANVWAMLVAIVSVPALLHGLGPTVFGTWVLIQTFSAVNGWLSLADLGVNVSTTKSVAERASMGDNQGAADVIVTALIVFLVLGLCFAALLAWIGPIVLPSVFNVPSRLVPEVRGAIELFALQVVVDLLTEGCEACLEGVQRVDLSRAVDALRRTAVAVAVVGAALSGAGLRGVAAMSLAASCIGLLVGLAVVRHHLPAAGGRIRLTEARALLRYGKDIALMRPFGILHRSMDRLVVGAVLGPAAVALVEIATQLQSGADAILGASSYSVLPAAAWLSARMDRGALRELIQRGTRYSLLVTLPVVIGTATLAGPVVRLWVGSSYHDAVGLVVVALMYEVVVAPLAVGSNVLLGVGRAPVILRAAALASLINLVATVILVQVSGIVGAFEATLLSACALDLMLARAVLAEADTGWQDFARATVFRALGPSLALVAVLSAVLAIHFGDVATVIAGSVAGGAVYSAVALRWALAPSERSQLMGLIRVHPKPTEAHL